MGVLRIWGDAVLRKKCLPVTEFTDELRGELRPDRRASIVAFLSW